MEIIKYYLENNDCFKNNVNRIDSRYTLFQKRGPTDLMLHSVGCAQPQAIVFIRNWNKPGIEKCVHGFIDANTGDYYETMPQNYRGWHAGGSANNTHLGVEMCESSWIEYQGNKIVVKNLEKAQADCKRAYETAVEVFAMYCKQYNLNPKLHICSHREGWIKGIASNHGDPEYYWKSLSMPYTMDGFRNDVEAEMNKPENPFIDVNNGSWYYDATMWAYQNGITAGTDATHFSPNKNCTRAMVVVFLYKTAKWILAEVNKIVNGGGS